MSDILKFLLSGTDGGGRVLGNSEYGGGVTVFKGGYFIDLKVL